MVNGVDEGDEEEARCTVLLLPEGRVRARDQVADMTHPDFWFRSLTWCHLNEVPLPNRAKRACLRTSILALAQRPPINSINTHNCIS